jgi:hypothetical protein
MEMKALKIELMDLQLSAARYLAVGYPHSTSAVTARFCRPGGEPDAPRVSESPPFSQSGRKCCGRAFLMHGLTQTPFMSRVRDLVQRERSRETPWRHVGSGMLLRWDGGSCPRSATRMSISRRIHWHGFSVDRAGDL